MSIVLYALWSLLYLLCNNVIYISIIIGEMSAHFFCPFFNRIFCWFIGVLYIVWIFILFYFFWRKNNLIGKGNSTHHFIQWVQSLSHVRLFATPWTAASQASLSITNSRGSLKLMSIKSLMPSSHLILCRPLLLLPSIIPSNRVFSNESALCIRWSKYYFQLHHQSFQWTPRTDFL